MSNLLDYLEWRGDLTFAQAPFNEVDNLILSENVFFLSLAIAEKIVYNSFVCVSLW